MPSGKYLYNDSSSIFFNETSGNNQYIVKGVSLVANKMCVANASGTGVNCTANIPTGGTGSEVDPYWSGNYTPCTATQKLYFAGGSLGCSADLDTDTWAGNYTSYYTKTQGNATYVNWTGYNKTSWDAAYQYATNSTFYINTNPYSFYNSTTIPAYYSLSNPYGYYNSTTIPAYLLTVANLPSANITSLNCGKLTGNVSDLCSMTPGDGGGVPTILTANKMCVANSTANGINCTADIPTGGAETDPYWTSNQSSYYTIVQANASYIKFSNWLNCTGSNNFTNILGGCGTVSFTGYYTSTQTDTAINNANTSMKDYVDGRDASYNTSMDTFVKAYVGAANTSMKSYVDGQDTAYNSSMKTYVDAVNGTMKSYADGRDTATNTSATGFCSALDTATNTSLKNWITGQNYLTSYTETDPKVALLTANKWCMANSTGTGINCTANAPSATESDPYWTANYTACSSTQKLYFNGYSLACTNENTETDPKINSIIARQICIGNATGTGIECNSAYIGTPVTMTANKMCVANSTADGINCTADIPTGGSTPEVDPFNPVKNASIYAWSCDYQSAVATSMCPGWVGAAISSGTNVANTTDPEKVNHPGIVTFRSSTTTNSGYQFSTEATQFHINGSETLVFIFKFLDASTLNTSVIRMGFQDVITTSNPVDGVYINVTGMATKVLRGTCRSNSVETDTASSYTPTQNTWYRGTIIVNASATNVTFRLQNVGGSVVWEDYCVTNIPTGSGRYTGHAVVTFLGGITARDVMSMDYMSVYIDRSLVR